MSWEVRQTRRFARTYKKLTNATLMADNPQQRPAVPVGLHARRRGAAGLSGSTGAAREFLSGCEALTFFTSLHAATSTVATTSA